MYIRLLGILLLFRTPGLSMPLQRTLSSAKGLCRFSHKLTWSARFRSSRPRIAGSARMSTIEHVHYPGFSFDTQQPDPTCRARLGKLVTPHGAIETPNFIFCATKAAMKATTVQQLRSEETQIILSNTYHLMLTPGPDIIEAMGGLQKFTGWNGPMLTDSGGYQIFSMGFGSVSNEIKGKRDTEAMGWTQSLIKIDETGATFRSYVDGSILDLTPEKSIDIQRKLGADLIVVLDECTPFNVEKSYTKSSMERSHRWAVRSLQEFLRQAHSPSDINDINGIDNKDAIEQGRQSSDTAITSKYYGKQALYGIIQGGVYDDLRKQSVEFVNQTPFFGTAIGGSLGASREEMHRIVTLTRGMVRDDRPCHLLGIGGVRDIFHGVRQGVDTFDCVHPSRLGRHGGALVKAAFWEEEPHPVPVDTIMTRAAARREEKLQARNARSELDKALNRALQDAREVVVVDQAATAPSSTAVASTSAAEATLRAVSTPPISGEVGAPTASLKEIRTARKEAQAKVREHMNLDKARMRNDPRVIDPTCSCYTCRNGEGFSRAYLHHLFKAKELLGGTLVTIHNVHFMNKLMASIREGIASGTLDAVENEYVHRDLKDKRL